MMIIRIANARRLTVLAAAFFVRAAAPASAQSVAIDPRWEPWLGCWKPVPQTVAPPRDLPLVCVTPTRTAGAVQIATVDNGAVATRDTIDAGGAQHAVDKQGCMGW